MSVAWPTASASSNRAMALLFFMMVPALNTVNQIAVKFTAASLKTQEFGSGWLQVAWLDAAAKTGWFWLSMASEAAVFGIWLQILRNVSLGVAYSLTSLCYVAVLLASWAIFHERISLIEAAGMSLILLGVYFISGEGELVSAPGPKSAD